MIKNLCQLESIVDGKTGRFHVEQDTSVDIAEKMCLEFLRYLGNIRERVKAQQQSPSPDIPKCENVNEEEAV